MKGEKGERRKTELLKIAYRMFIEKGYDNTSIDEIIADAGIAKGTYYYYFPSKEATLEAVIDMMINEEVERARAAISVPIPVPQKIIAVIMSMRPRQEESGIAHTLERSENNTVFPLLSGVPYNALDMGALHLYQGLPQPTY